MELKVFDASLARKQKPGSPTVHINFKVGIFTFGQAAMRMMDIKMGDQVKIGFDEKNNDWYIWKVSSGGFLLRAKKSERSGSYAIMFNSAATSEEIANNTKYRGDSAIIPIGTEPVIEDNDQYIVHWPIITAKLISNI
jgi:hypothetical protein